MAFTNIFRKVFHHIMAVALPPTCILCKVHLPAEEFIGVCSKCWPYLPFWKLEDHTMPQIPKYIDSFTAPFLYKDEVRVAVQSMKFQDQQELARPLAAFMTQKIPNSVNPLIVAVPVHPKRLQRRLFNQASFLAKCIAYNKKYFYDVGALKKVKHTRSQVSKTATQRKKLPLNTFKANKKSVAGRNIILIDDIWTTGTTANACACALKRAGAKRVDVVTLAYVALDMTDRVDFDLHCRPESVKTSF